ncbi:MAG: hypothetical protein QXU98_12555 [Candidatus Parvarchaeota archaeon]
MAGKKGMKWRKKIEQKTETGTNPSVPATPTPNLDNQNPNIPKQEEKEVKEENIEFPEPKEEETKNFSKAPLKKGGNQKNNSHTLSRKWILAFLVLSLVALWMGRFEGRAILDYLKQKLNSLKTRTQK